MAMITDRDLLTIEPSIFVDAQGEGTLLIEASDASVTRSNRRLDSASSDFVSDGITTSHVIVVTYPTSDNQVLEITSDPSTTTLVVSRIRAQPSAPTDAGLAAQSALYSIRVKETAHQTRVLIDLDGDGLPEATRRIDVLALVRD